MVIEGAEIRNNATKTYAKTPTFLDFDGDLGK